MPLRFPNLAAVRLAITSGTVPESVSTAPVKAAFGLGGEIWLQPAGRLPRSVQAALRRMDVQVARSAAVPLNESLVSWLQLFPLVPDAAPADLGDRTPVLFDLPEPGQLAEVVGEVLRLGNDRQSFCHVTDGETRRTLLRVIGPPYYSLLRALDRDSGGQPAGRAPPYAYVEHRAGVWVEIGHTHPFADRLVPPAGRLLLVRAPRVWQFVEETPFRDVYQVLDYELPRARSAWQPEDLEHRIAVPLRFTSGGTEAAELWVLRDGAEDQLDQLAGAADDQLLGRLAFAVGEHEGRRTVVLRARPSKQAPPVLVLNAVAFRSYLKVANLFVPCGKRLHPPLHRNAVARLLASDRSRITWLYPHEDGGFTPESLPDAAFRPLSDWVDYVLDREHEALTAWVDAHRFDFEPFVCKDDRRKREDKPKGDRRSPSKPSAETPASTAAPDGSPQGEETEAPPAEKAPPEAVEPTAETEFDAAHKRLFELEQQFLALNSPADGDDRTVLWHRMARANCALGHHLNGGICWAGAIWERDELPASSRDAWLESIRRGSGLSLKGAQLDQILSERDPMPDRAVALAGYVICAARMEPPPRALGERLGPVAQYLERQEALLPVRSAWLAWCAVSRLSGGDVLALARARDRALERLHQHGLRPELDLPSFLRSVGMADSQRLRVVSERISPLHKLVYDWIEEPVAQPSPRTRAYAGLMFAYAMAQLGETTPCQVLLEEAREAMVGRDPVHRWVWEAFDYRIRQALDGRPGQGPLPRELLDRLEAWDRQDRYKVDRLRQHSRILEPHEKFDPYRTWKTYTKEFDRELSTLCDVHDREKLKKKIDALLEQVEGEAVREARLLTAALEAAPRLGESYAATLLARVARLVRQQRDLAAAQELLEKALFVAAHFDQADHVQAFMRLIYDSLSRQQLDQADDALERLIGECLRGLRKLGMRDEIGQLLARIASLARRRHDRPKEAEPAARDERRGVLLRPLLLVASGWLYFGQQDQAMPVLDEARDLLVHGGLKSARQSKLACAYLNALGYAPVDVALPRIEELFGYEKPPGGGKPKRRLDRLRAPLTTTTHFSLFHLDVVEATVLALVSEEFTLNSESRRWLDEDEFLVRRRIHRDVREAMAAAST